MSSWIVSESVLNACRKRLVTSLTRTDCSSTSWNTGRWLIGTSGNARPLTISGTGAPAVSVARRKNTSPELYSVATP